MILSYIFTVCPRFIYTLTQLHCIRLYVFCWVLTQKSFTAFPSGYLSPEHKVELITYGIFLQAVYDSEYERLSFLVKFIKLAVDPNDFFVYIVVEILIQITLFKNTFKKISIDKCKCKYRSFSLKLGA